MYPEGFVQGDERGFTPILQKQICSRLLLATILFSLLLLVMEKRLTLMRSGLLTHQMPLLYREASYKPPAKSRQHMFMAMKFSADSSRGWEVRESFVYALNPSPRTTQA